MLTIHDEFLSIILDSIPNRNIVYFSKARSLLENLLNDRPEKQKVIEHIQSISRLKCKKPFRRMIIYYNYLFVMIGGFQLQILLYVLLK